MHNADLSESYRNNHETSPFEHTTLTRINFTKPHHDGLLKKSFRGSVTAFNVASGDSVTRNELQAPIAASLYYRE